MSKIIVFNMISLDGFFAGSDGDISWHNVDEEFNEFAIKHTQEFGTLIFGRVTYDLMYSYWPLETTIKNDPIVAGIMNKANKIVFSRNMKQPDWNNTKLIRDINAAEIQKIKQASDKDLAVFGSGTIAQQLTSMGLVDEYRLMVNPLTLGAGKPLFKAPQKFTLLSSREFKNGNLLICYQIK